MIKINKKKSDCPPEVLIAGKTERTLNIAAVKNRKFKDLQFKVYKNKVLNGQLIKVFKNKCAYCESFYSAATSPWDIEHFRPKSKTFRKGQLKKGFIGYYWLAADWDNLLLSCINCNRPKQHSVPGKSTKITIGKHEQFPLDTPNEKFRCSSPSAAKLLKENKISLLIHPCKENGELYFEFEEIGHFPGNIKAKTGLTGFRLRKAEKSIEVYALHRIDLVKARARLLNEIMYRITVINREINTRYNGATGKAKKESLKYIQDEIDGLVNYALPEKEYSALAKQVIGPFIKKIKTSISSLHA